MLSLYIIVQVPAWPFGIAFVNEWLLSAGVCLLEHEVFDKQ